MPRTRIKFCGIRTAGDARLAASAGADAVGMILHANAKRLIDHATARDIIAALPPYVCPVGVFVDASAKQINEMAAALGLTTVQLHGDESPATVSACAVRVVKAIKVDSEIAATLAAWRAVVATGACPNLIALLLESPVAGQSGGTGVANDFARIAELLAQGAFNGLPPLILSGGLSPENVGAAIALVHPYGVDVSSGIESEFGKKSIDKMQRFAAAVYCDGASAARW